MNNERRTELIEAQRVYCRLNKLPFFAPPGGRCCNCGEDIVDENWEKYLITGCPKCHRSFCD